MYEVRRSLESLAEGDYKKFNEKIVPGAKNMLGVRLPKMREIAKARAKHEPERYFNEIEEAITSGREDIYYEEIMIYGLIIGYAKFTDEKRCMWLEKFIPHIDNWAICDSCCMTYKWMKKNPEFWWGYLEECIQKDTEYSIRIAVVSMLAHFVNEEYIEKILSYCDQICHDGYYVKMAVAWAVSVCFVKYPAVTRSFLKENHMDAFTQKKAIQKICDSYRVTKEEKQEVRRYKKC
jgi:3-methyladenine DNA glycosylase AlkD